MEERPPRVWDVAVNKGGLRLVTRSHATRERPGDARIVWIWIKLYMRFAFG